MTKVHTPESRDEHRDAAGALAGSLLNTGTAEGLEATRTRTIPTVPVSPALLREGDMIHPNINPDAPAYAEVPDGHHSPFRVLGPAERLASGWRITLEGGCVLLVAEGHRIRTQRRPNPGPPTPDEVWDAAEDSYRRNRYG